MKNLCLLTAAFFAAVLYGAVSSEVIEAESVLTGITTGKNALSSSRWDVWNRDKNAAQNWSGGATIRGGAVRKNSTPENASLPVLTFDIPVRSAGIYDLYVTLGGRPLSVSTDGGKTWKTVSGKVRLIESRFARENDSISIKIAANVLSSGNVGPVYVDCFTLEKMVELIDGKYFNIKFEAESVLIGGNLAKNAFSSTRWDVWDKDKNAEQNWSRGATIRGGTVKADSAPEKASLPILNFSVPVPEAGTYSLFAKLGGRPLSVSTDGGKSWRKISGGNAVIFRNQVCNAGDKLNFKIAANVFSTGNPGHVYIDCFTLSNVPVETGLLNLDFRRKNPDGSIPGWTARFQNKHPKNLLEIKETPQGRKLRIFNGGGDTWGLANTGVIDGIKAGERYELKFEVTNQAKNRYRIIATFHGMIGKRHVRPFIGMVEDTINPGETKTISSIATITSDVPELQIDIHGFNSGADFLFSPFTITKLPDITESAKSINWQQELNSEPAKPTTIRPVMPGSALRISLNMAGNAPANGKLTVQGFASTQLYYSRLKTIDLDQAADGKYSLDMLIPYDVDGIRLLYTGNTAFDSLKADPIPLNLPVTRPAKLNNGAAERIYDRPGRGLIAMPDNGRVYLSWRINPGEEDAAFNVFAEVDGNRTKLNAEPVRQTSDFIVEKPVAGAEYIVEADGIASGRAAVLPAPDAGGVPHRSFKLTNPQAVPQRVAIADLDGDGEYDYIVQHSSYGVDPWYRAWRASKTQTVMEAFHRDGRRLWTYTYPWNIEGGTWYIPWLVYDLDGDGKAEVVIKSTLPEDGDLREPAESINAGKVISGPERLIILDGMTGKETVSAEWPARDEFYIREWGYNFSSRNQMTIAYLDGKTPCIIALRGTYGLMLAEAWQLKDGKLQRIWQYNSREFGRKYHCQGAHTTRVADIDGDGRDEIALGAAILDDDGSPMWSTGLGHPDFIYIAEYVRENPGLEIVTLYETGTPGGGGVTCADARTGKTLWRLNKPAKHIHYGYSGDIDPRYRGWEVGGEDVVNGGHNGSRRSYHFSPTGKILAEGPEAPFAYYKNFAPKFAYWDGDLFREEVGNQIFDFRGGQLGGILEGDILRIFDSDGDWREEIATGLKGELRIYSTSIPAVDRRTSLMHDSLYRLGVTSNANGYWLDATHVKLLADESPGIALTVLAGKKNTLEITVSAPLDVPVKGVVKLAEQPQVTFSRREIPVNVPAGKEATFTVTFNAPDKLLTFIEALLTFNGGKTLKGRVQLGTTPAPWEMPLPAPAIEAEAFSSQENGEVMIRTDKNGTHEKCISHWDRNGHRINWDIKVDEAGKYALMIRYCTTANYAVRTLYVNGKRLGAHRIPGTGGLGISITDWHNFTMPVEFDLPAGTHRISLENANGSSMNLDYIRLIKK